MGLVAFGARQSLPIERLAPEAVVFIARGTPGPEVAALRDRVRQLAGVSDVTWIARDAAWQELGKRAAIPSSEVKANPLPDVLVVRLGFGAAVADLEQTSADIAKLGKVDGVQSDWGWYQRLERWLRLAKELAPCRRRPRRFDVAPDPGGRRAAARPGRPGGPAGSGTTRRRAGLRTAAFRPGGGGRDRALEPRSRPRRHSPQCGSWIRWSGTWSKATASSGGLLWPEPVWLAAGLFLAVALGAAIGSFGWGRTNS